MEESELNYIKVEDNPSIRDSQLLVLECLREM